jgi:hypothetical protein
MSSIAPETEVRNELATASPTVQPPAPADVATVPIAVGQPEPESDRPPRTSLRRADQLGIAVLSLLALVMIGGYWVHQAVIRHRLIDLDKAPPLDPTYRVDINSADWSDATSPKRRGTELVPS